eukprot:4721975-Heterocapsa_arctica.AAC.1
MLNSFPLVDDTTLSGDVREQEPDNTRGEGTPPSKEEDYSPLGDVTPIGSEEFGGCQGDPEHETEKEQDKLQH